MIGYRIPTEDKYSMLPLVVKGFLPASAGGAVMLPMEITTISCIVTGKQEEAQIGRAHV